jgi:hypothetical protein
MRTATASPASPKLEFRDRAKVRKTELAIQRRFPSLCGRYAVSEIKSLIRAHDVSWLAIRVLEKGEFIIARLKVRKSAEQACLDHLEGKVR